MSGVKRQRVTKHIDPHTRKQVPSGTPGAEVRSYLTRVYYGTVCGRRVKLLRSKSASLVMLARLQAEADPHSPRRWDAPRALPLAGHLAEYTIAIGSRLSGRPPRLPTAKHVEDVAADLRRAVAALGWVMPSDLAADAARPWLASRTRPADPPEVAPEGLRLREVAALLRVKGPSVMLRVRSLGLAWRKEGRHRLYPPETVRALWACNPARRAACANTASRTAYRLRRFGDWLSSRCGWEVNPLASIGGAGGSMDTCHVHDRRSLSAEELGRLLATTRASPRVSRGLTGPDRWALYLYALSSGFRANEAASLRPASFLFDRTPPVAVLSQRRDKSRRGVEQPLPREAADLLRDWMAGRDPAAPCWPGTWVDAPVQVLRRDLREAGIPYRVEGPDGPLYADFHALRHTYIASLERAGVSLKTAMQLARHGNPVLTARVYGRASLSELGEAVAGLTFGGGKVTPEVTPPNADDRPQSPMIADEKQRGGRAAGGRKSKTAKGDPAKDDARQ